jgi:hypothetical protein
VCLREGGKEEGRGGRTGKYLLGLLVRGGLKEEGGGEGGEGVGA